MSKLAPTSGLNTERQPTATEPSLDGPDVGPVWESPLHCASSGSACRIAAMVCFEAVDDMQEIDCLHTTKNAMEPSRRLLSVSLGMDNLFKSLWHNVLYRYHGVKHDI